MLVIFYINFIDLLKSENNRQLHSSCEHKFDGSMVLRRYIIFPSNVTNHSMSIDKVRVPHVLFFCFIFKHVDFRCKET